MLRLTSRGDYSKTLQYLKHVDHNMDIPSTLDKYGQIGVDRLSKATPVESGETANSWGYYIEDTKNGYKLCFTNTHTKNDYHIVVLIRYGHVTVGGTWVEGNDFVTPVISDLCSELRDNI